VEERSFQFRGIRISYLHGGSGFPILMIHGSGPGASTIGNWRLVLEPLAARYEIYAMDLVGFGKSGRKQAPPFFDFPLWLDQCREMLSRITGSSVGIIGHSISGALGLRLAAGSSRISKVMTTGTMGAAFEPTAGTYAAWTFPKTREELKAAAARFVFDKTLIDDAYIANRERVLFQGDYQSYFSEMFAGDKRQYIRDAIVSESELKSLSCDVLMVHGRDDEGFPAEPLTLTMMKFIPHADIALIGRCSHSVAFEHPGKFMSLANHFFG
jgi:2-hydroxymuconate-semialdehyde hydrolase